MLLRPIHLLRLALGAFVRCLDAHVDRQLHQACHVEQVVGEFSAVVAPLGRRDHQRDHGATTQFLREPVDDCGQRAGEILQRHVGEVFGILAVLVLRLPPIRRIEENELYILPSLDGRQAIRHVPLPNLVLPANAES